MMKTKFIALLAVGVMTTVGCDSGDDGGSDGAVTTVAGTGMGDDGGATTAADTASPDDGVADTMMADVTGNADTAMDDNSGACDPECPAGEECIAGTCFPAADGPMDTGADTAGVMSDPNYPDPGDGCPAPSIDGNMAVNVNICMQPCDPTAANIVAACPQPATGTAPAVCAVGDGMGSGDACEMNGLACDVDGEWCLGNPMTMMNECTTASLCFVSCQGGAACPDGMTCSNNLCAY